MNINNKLIEKLFNEHLNPLENKIDNLSKTADIDNVKINFEGGNPKQIKELLNGIENFKKIFPFYYNNLADKNINIIFKDNMLQSMSHTGSNIFVNSSIPIDKIKTTIAHELTHNYQWSNEGHKELQDYNKEFFNEYININIREEHAESVESIIRNVYNKIPFEQYSRDEKWIIQRQQQISNLTSKDIFDITTTGMPYYDAMIQKGHIAGNRDPIEYFKTSKGITFEIVYMSPEEYLRESYKLQHYNIDYLKYKFPLKYYIERSINPDKINEYLERTLEGSKMPIPVLDYNLSEQEGRHRAVVAMELGVEEIPVLVVRTYEE